MGIIFRNHPELDQSFEPSKVAARIRNPEVRARVERRIQELQNTPEARRMRAAIKESEYLTATDLNLIVY